MKKIQKAFTVSAVIALALLLGAPAARAQIVVDLVDAVAQETVSRGWAADAAELFSHPTRPEHDLVLAQCFQDALASGDHPDIEAAWTANLAYFNSALPLTVTWMADNAWNSWGAEYLVFVIMNMSTDAAAQQDYFDVWWVGWSNAFGDGLAPGDSSNVDFSAQASVEAMYDTCLAPPASGPTATITRSATSPDPDSAFTAGSGSWDVEFSEAVLNVDGTDFSLDTLGTAAATGPTVTGGPTSYVASISGVGGTGSITLNFNVGNVVAEGDGTTPALAASSGSQWFSNVVAAPAATGWMLVFLGLVLFLAATVVIRRKALKH